MSGEGSPGFKGYVLAIALIATVAFISLIFMGGQISQIHGGVGNSI